jgi:hypothetical protein
MYCNEQEQSKQENRTMAYYNSSEKLKQPRMHKTVAAANLRQRRRSTASPNLRHCPECGFRIRGVNHENGVHHNDSVPVCHR